MYYNLCLTLSLGLKLSSSYWQFPKKIDIEFLLRTLRNVRNVKVPFFSSCTQCAVFSCAIDAAQLVWCILYFNLKTFPGWVFFAQKLYVEKCCGHYVADITHVRFFIYSGCCGYLVLTISELDSDNSPLNTKLLFIDVQM